MSLIRSLLGIRAEAAPRSPLDDFYYTSAGTMSAAGIRVSEPMAMKLSAVFAGRRAIAQPLGMIPLVLNEHLPNGRKRRATEHPLYSILHDAPNPEMTAMEFREAMTAHAVMRGTGYARIVPDYQRGLAVGRLDMLHPDQVKPETLPSGATRYIVRDERTGQESNVLYDEMFKVRGMTLDGVTGVSVLTYARESIGLGLGQQAYAAGFYRNSASPRGIIESNVTDVEARRRMLAQWQERNAGVDNAHKTAVLPPGFNWKATGLTMEDAQFVESELFQLGEWARWIGVPPHVLADLSRATFSNIEELAIEYVVFGLSPWGVRWEQSVSRDLLLPEDRQRYRAQYVWDALLRGKTLERYQAHALAIQWSWKSLNEVRVIEDLDPKDGLDEHLIPANMVPLSQIGQRAEQATATARVFALDAAASVLRMEIGKVSRASVDHADDGDGWARFLDEFYAEHAHTLEKRLHLAPAIAEATCRRHRGALLARGVGVLEDWEVSEVSELAELAASAVTAPVVIVAEPVMVGA